MTYKNPKGATGTRLKLIREGAGFLKRSHAIAACNSNSIKWDSGVTFTEKSMRRFEELGITGNSYASGPTYEELHIMMRTYNGSLGFLIWGLPPMHYPIKKYDELLNTYLSSEVLDHVAWLAQLPKHKRLKVMELMQEVIN
ncbi:hypothetical protein ACU6U9_02870 [Pseudomonas sp. HK3]